MSAATPVAAARPRTSSWVPAYTALALIWGSSFLFIKVADREIAPPYVALGRVVCGALILLTAVILTRDRLPRPARVWGHLAVFAILANTAPFILFAYAERDISSALAGIWNAVTPLTTLAVTLVALPQERPSRHRVAGLAIGFLGALVVLGIWQGVGGATLRGQLMCFAAVSCYGIGFPYVRRFLTGSGYSGTAISAGQLSIASLQLAVLAPLLSGGPPSIGQLSDDAVVSVLALGVLGTGVAFVLNFRVVRLAGANTGSTVSYLVPVVAAAVGAVVLGERFTWHQPAGAIIVLAGVAVSQGILQRSRPVSSTAAVSSQAEVQAVQVAEAETVPAEAAEVEAVQVVEAEAVPAEAAEAEAEAVPAEMAKAEAEAVQAAEAVPAEVAEAVPAVSSPAAAQAIAAGPDPAGVGATAGAPGSGGRERVAAPKSADVPSRQLVKSGKTARSARSSAGEPDRHGEAAKRSRTELTGAGRAGGRPRR